MASEVVSENTRITAAATWTEVAGATKGLTGFNADNDTASLDVLIQNFDADPNTVLVAITATSTAPAADTDANYSEVLDNLGKLQLDVLLKNTQHLWVKSDQTDTRVLVTGYKEETA